MQHPPSRRVIPVRVRILATVLSTTAIALGSVGLFSYVLQHNAIGERLEASLIRTTQEFTTYAESTAGSTAPLRELLTDGMRHHVMAPNEGMLGFLDDQPAATGGSGLDLMADPELVDHLTADVQAGRSRISSIQTELASYQYAVVQAHYPDQGTISLAIAYDRAADLALLTDWIRTYALVSVGALVVVAAAGWWLTGRILRPLRELRTTAAQISESDLSGRIGTVSNDELGDLANTFDSMLDRLENAFQQQRQLLDDAGHELRTPITIVRGHMELMDPTDPVDAAETRQLAMSELDRMHRLADDLVLLAKAEQPGFIQPALVDTGAMTDNALEQARRLGDRNWQLDGRAHDAAYVDDQRLTQAWLELAKNAVKFSAPGSVVALGSQLADGRLRLWVRDEGVGIPPEEQEHIFDRFRQVANAPRTADTRGGAGLGLAIVAAIAAGHGGTAFVQSTQGVGSTFVLDLPADPKAPQGGY
jgi:two-component system OmpR family sensor kinase